MPLIQVACSIKPTPIEAQNGATDKVHLQPVVVEARDTNHALALVFSANPLPADIDGGRFVPFVKAL